MATPGNQHHFSFNTPNSFLAGKTRASLVGELEEDTEHVMPVAFWILCSGADHLQDLPFPPLPCSQGWPALRMGKGGEQAHLALASKPVLPPAPSVIRLVS